jgi:DNA-binding transcriptional MocR family regulator
LETKIRSDRRFAIIDEWVLDLDISDRAIRLYAVLNRYADKDTNKAFPSRQTLADRLRCSPKSVDRALDELIQFGLLKKQQRHNSSLIFTLVTPVSRGVDSGDQGGWTPVTRGVDTGDDLTRTTKREPKNDNHLTRPTNADEYEPSEELLEKLAIDFPGVRLESQLEKFRDHHMAAGSTFKIWDRAFRKWVRQASEWSPEARAARSRAEEMAKIQRIIEEEGI